MEDLETKCYDKFDFKLDDLQILIAKAGKCVLALYVKCRYKFCTFLFVNLGFPVTFVCQELLFWKTVVSRWESLPLDITTLI